MIIFNTISTFRTRLQNLLDIRKGVYASIPAEIKREFQSASIDTIRNNRDMILIQNEAVIVKLSKANGYRLIYMVSTIIDRVVFLDVFPKRGPLQQLNIDDKEILRLIEEFNSEASNGLLKEYEF